MGPKPPFGLISCAPPNGLPIWLGYSSAEIFDRPQALLKNLAQNYVRLMLTFYV